MKKLQLQQIIKEEISKVLKESVNEGLSNYSLLDFFKEMQSFPAAGVDAKDIKGASQPHNKKKTVKNTPELKRLLDDWQSGRYDEDPGTLVGELRHLLATNSKDVRTGFSASDIKSLDVVADDISDAFSKYGTLKLHLPYNKWVKMDDDEKAWNVEQALYKLTKSSTVKKLLSKKEDDVIAYIVKVLSESVKKENMKKSTKLFNEAAIDMPINKWERTAVAFEEGPMIVGSHKGKYYIATGITEPGSMDKIIDVIDVEPVSKSDYDFIQKKQM